MIARSLVLCRLGRKQPLVIGTLREGARRRHGADTRDPGPRAFRACLYDRRCAVRAAGRSGGTRPGRALCARYRWELRRTERPGQTVLGNTLAIYVGVSQDAEPADLTGAEVTFLPGVSFYALALPLDTPTVDMDSSAYLATLLTLQTPYSFQAVPPPVPQPGVQEAAVLWLEGAIAAPVPPPWQRWVGLVVQALGIAEAQLPPEAVLAQAPQVHLSLLGHDVLVQGSSSTGAAAQLTVRVQPSAVVRTWAQQTPPPFVQRVAIGPFLARLVHHHTGLPFTVMS